MSLATLSSKDLSRIQKLIERKEILAEQIAEINNQLEAIESGVPAAPSTPIFRSASEMKPAGAAPSAVTRRKNRAGRTVRGQLKEQISSELKSAGKQGVKVKDLASRIGTSYGNITAFFQSTGKKMKEIKKVGPAQFAWVGA